MPTLTIKNAGAFEVEEGERLVNAITQAGVDIGHRCGGQARCTTCRVRFEAGEPDVLTRAEFEKLQGLNEDDVRLACQIVVDRDMTVEPVFLAHEQAGWDDPGPAPAVEVEPAPAWFPIEQLAGTE